MRRIISGSILTSWIVFMIVAGVGGFSGIGESGGLLLMLQMALVGITDAGLPVEAVRAAITIISAVLFAAMLWALMFAVSTDREDAEGRLFAMAVAYCATLAAISVASLVVLVGGVTAGLATLLAMHLTTLVSMIASCGVEIAWERRPYLREHGNDNDRLAFRISNQMAIASAKLAAMGPSARNSGVSS